MKSFVSARVQRISLLCLSSLFGVSGYAQSVEVVRIEEDWELRVEMPDVTNTAPQVTCSFAPDESTLSPHAAFELNFRTLPAFASGGLQLQVWKGEQVQDVHTAGDFSTMSQPNETVQWTQRMSLEDGHLTFSIVDGNSATWGAFGGDGALGSTVPVEVENLNGYSPDASVQNSGIGFARNLVRSLELKRVRYHLASGDVVEDSTVRSVFAE